MNLYVPFKVTIYFCLARYKCNSSKKGISTAWASGLAMTN